MARLDQLGPHDPRQAGPFDLRARIGRGGQGWVYLGVRPDGVRAAVKILHSDWAGSGDLERELASARRVNPFCTAAVIDWDVDGPLPFIATEYIEGPTLFEKVHGSGVLTDNELYRLAVNTLTALWTIHSAGVVHHDFKPGNVMLGPDGHRVIDFGISRTTDATPTAGRPRGTFAYMAPEQFANVGVGPPADLFAWGATVVYAATGRPAFPGRTDLEIMHRILHGSPELYGLHGPLGELVRECLHRDATRRPTAAQAQQRLVASRQPVPTQRSAPAGPPAPPTAVDPVRVGGRAPAPTRVMPVPDDMTCPPTRPPSGDVRRLLLIAVLAVIPVAVAAGAWALEQDPPPGNPTPAASAAAMSPELAALAAPWSARSCGRGYRSRTQAEKWICRSGGVEVSLIRYDAPGLRDTRRGEAQDMRGYLDTARWRGGTVASPDGTRRGPYVEYLYRAGDDSGFYAAIWWDDEDSHPDGTAAVNLRMPAVAGAGEPPDPLRRAWRERGYRGP